MNIRKFPYQVIPSFILLNFKSNNYFSERIINISADFKSRIDSCRKDCASLKDRLDTRLRVDTNIQVKDINIQLKDTNILVKEIKGGVQQTGIFLLACSYLSSNLFVVDTGRMVNAIIDDKQGAFELRSCIN